MMCTEMDRWSDPSMGAALVTEIVEQSISGATMSMHEKGVPRYREVGKSTSCSRPYNLNKSRSSSPAASVLSVASHALFLAFRSPTMMVWLVLSLVLRIHCSSVCRAMLWGLLGGR